MIDKSQCSEVAKCRLDNSGFTNTQCVDHVQYRAFYQTCLNGGFDKDTCAKATQIKVKNPKLNLGQCVQEVHIADCLAKYDWLTNAQCESVASNMAASKTSDLRAAVKAVLVEEGKALGLSELDYSRTADYMMYVKTFNDTRAAAVARFTQACTNEFEDLNLGSEICQKAALLKVQDPKLSLDTCLGKVYEKGDSFDYPHLKSTELQQISKVSQGQQLSIAEAFESVFNNDCMQAGMTKSQCANLLEYSKDNWNLSYAGSISKLAELCKDSLACSGLTGKKQSQVVQKMVETGIWDAEQTVAQVFPQQKTTLQQPTPSQDVEMTDADSSQTQAPKLQQTDHCSEYFKKAESWGWRGTVKHFLTDSFSPGKWACFKRTAEKWVE